jgi:hypothetical protein
MPHPHLPRPRPLAVPGIGFPQNISISQPVLDLTAFADRQDVHCAGSPRMIERIAWVPSPRRWFALRP